MSGLDSSLVVGSWCQGLACSVSVCGELRPKHHFASVTPARMNWGGLNPQHRILCSVLSLAQPRGVLPLTLCLCAQQCLMQHCRRRDIPRGMRGHTALCASSAITHPAVPLSLTGPCSVCEASVPTLLLCPFEGCHWVTQFAGTGAQHC